MNCRKPFFLMLSLVLTVTALSAQEYGLASFYSDDFHGSRTAYGEIYDKNKLTAAHKTHPYGTILKVSLLDNSRSVTVRITDKGPFIKGRVVDLSKRAAEKLGLVESGTMDVKVEVVSKMDTEAATVVNNKNIPAIPRALPSDYNNEGQAKNNAADNKPAGNAATSTNNAASTPAKIEKTDPITPISNGSKFPLVGKNFKKFGLYKLDLQKPEQKGFGVQIMYLSTYENLLQQIANLQAKSFDNVLVSIEKGTGSSSVFKLIMGPFSTSAAANAYRNSLKAKHKIDGFVLNLAEIKY